ncbi:MAG: hypothetical protein ACP5XB_04915 [Isosphaeraceae bacterium]
MPDLGRKRRVGALPIVGTVLCAMAALAAVGYPKVAGLVQTSTGAAPFNPRPYPLALKTNFARDHISLGTPVSDREIERLSRLFEPSRVLRSPSHLLHYLYLWGPEARFDNPHCPSGQQMLALLLDGSREESYLATRPIAYTDGLGRVSIDTSASNNSEVHVDQFLSMVGDLGVSLDSPIQTEKGSAPLKEALKTSIDNFTMSQELEWSICTYARYLPPARKWRNKWGEEFSFDDVVDAFLKRGLGVGPCAGTHALQALCTILQADEQYPIITQLNRSRIKRKLSDVSSLLERNQHPEGCWSPKWATASRFTRYFPEERRAMFLATGHHLEWIRIAPPGTIPSRGPIRKALAWCFANLQNVDAQDVPDDPCPYVHCAKALICLSLRDASRSCYLSEPLHPDRGAGRPADTVGAGSRRSAPRSRQ